MKLRRGQRRSIVWMVVCIVYGYILGGMLAYGDTPLWLCIVVGSGTMMALSFLMGQWSAE
jgi:hypothetical protein